MATFYSGYRSVLRGRDVDNFVHTYKGVAGTYSYYPLMDTAPKMFAGAPETQRVLGDNRHAGILEYMFAGKHILSPMRNAGGGNRLPYARFSPLEYKGLNSAKVFKNGFGHVARDDIFTYSNYSNYVYDGLPNREALKNPGHARRFTGAYGYSGAFDPYVNQGIGKSARVMANPGSALPVGYNNPYGKNKVNEWLGTPSMKAL